MNIKLNSKTGNLEIDIQDFLDCLSSEAKITLIESLACQEAVIEHVTHQILNGWTENGFHGSRGGANEIPSCALDVATRKIAKSSNQVARREIERLEDSLKHKNKVIQDLYDIIYQRQHD